MRRTVSIVAAVIAALVAAAPASAAEVRVLPRVSGSGSIAGTAVCASPTDTPTGKVTSCGLQSNGFAGLPIPAVLNLFAAPQPSPAGHWEFVRWEGCPSGAGSQLCAFTWTDTLTRTFEIRAVFRDVKGPTISQPAVTYSTVNDRTVTMTYKSANEAVGSYTCSVDDAPFTACGNGSQSVTAAEGTHTFRVRGKDLSGNEGAPSTEQTFRIVDTALVDKPAPFSNVKSPTFTFSSAAGLTFDCSINNVTLTSCGTKDTSNNRGSKTFANLPDGVHTFRVAARNGAPDFDRVPAVYTWTVDTVAPTATLDPTSGPGEGALQAVNKETFKFASNEPGTLQCRLDAAAFAPCATDFLVERLSAGPHRFEVRAVDRAGNTGAVVARTWSVAAADNDNDGFNALIDCNDADPTIRPGAVEILDNAVDENCDGIVGTVLQNTKPEQIVVTLAFFAKATKKTTKLSTLQVKNVPLGSTVTVTCKGKACPKGLKGKGFTKKNAFGTVSLAAFIRKPFRTGDQITVTVSKPGAISAVKVLTARPAKKPSIATKCVPPGTTKPVAC